MKRVIPVLVLLAIATASTAFGDLGSIGTLKFSIDANAINPYTLVNTSVEQGYAGPYQYDLNGGGTINGFCLDLTTDIPVSTQFTFDIYQLDPTGFQGIPGGSPTPPPGNNIYQVNQAEKAIVSLVGYYLKDTGSAGVIPPLYGNGDGAPLSYQAVGLQLALWKIIDNATTTSFANPSTNSPNAIAYMNTLLTDINSAAKLIGGGSYTGAAGSEFNVEALVAKGGNPEQIQGLLINNGLPNEPTPEPAGLVALASMGLIALPFGARKVRIRRRKLA